MTRVVESREIGMAYRLVIFTAGEKGKEIGLACDLRKK